MKICVTASGETLESQVDPRFGRCDYFLFIETEDMACEALSNAQAQASGGAGIQSAQTVASKDVSVVLTGNVGPNAFRALSAADIKVITGASGTVRQAIEAYQNGLLAGTKAPTVESHAGLKKGTQ